MNTIAPAIFAIIVIFYGLYKLIVDSLHWGWGLAFVFLVVFFFIQELDYKSNKKYK